MPEKKATVTLSDILKAIGIVAQLLPALIAFIRAMETESLPGAQKKAAVMEFARAFLAGAGNYVSELTDSVQAAVLAAVDTVIDAVVAAYNAAKVFAHRG